MTFPHHPDFHYRLCERKNGTKFIKVITYIGDADGYVEVARINPIKTCWAEEGTNDIETIFTELQKNEQTAKSAFHQEGQ